ncbi:hypothetical protein GCM10010911_53400 [Paenibacillus nasutitermitis]|uniref:Uncharacterized protein n=1 Tax=Paenibacillus nasutitermitis TaxID=1652958 RepID=A0A917E089_9BACL|nr:hypothetical protein GCM10010911_53400 [Paenibacillus nasutitermitis]
MEEWGVRRIMKELLIQLIIREKRKQSSYTPSVVYESLKTSIPCHSPAAKNGDGYYLYL